MKTYIFQVTISEGSDEFWEGLKVPTGCDEVYDTLNGLLAGSGFDYDLELIQYKENKYDQDIEM